MKATYNKKEFWYILNKNGYSYHHGSGGHLIFKNKDNRHISVPRGNCGKTLMERIIKDYNLIV